MKEITRAEWKQVEQQFWDDYFQHVSAEELFWTVDALNWDSGIELANRLLDYPHVDQATVLLLYWKSAPVFSKQYLNREEVLADVSWYVDNFDWIERIEQQFLAGFWQNQQLAFGFFGEHGGENWVKHSTSSDMKREIPSIMKQSLQGVLSEMDIYEFDPEDIINRWFSLHEDYRIAQGI